MGMLEVGTLITGVITGPIIGLLLVGGFTKLLLRIQVSQCPLLPARQVAVLLSLQSLLPPTPQSLLRFPDILICTTCPTRGTAPLEPPLSSSSPSSTPASYQHRTPRKLTLAC